MGGDFLEGRKKKKNGKKIWKELNGSEMKSDGDGYGKKKW